MNHEQTIVGKVLYGLFFTVVIPAILVVWASATEQILRYPAFESKQYGTIIGVIGFVLMIWGMYALIRHGGGMPMNAYPPSKLVNTGPYRWLRNPIYSGFGVFIIGVSIFYGSASGLWLVSPVTILCMAALYWGYERIDLQSRFPHARITTYLDIPANAESASSVQGLSSILWLLSTLLLGNTIILYLHPDTIPLIGEMGHILPILADYPFHLLSLLFIIGVPLLVKRQDEIRRWIISSLIALALSFFIAILWPVIGAQFFLTEATEPDRLTNGMKPLLTIPIFLILLSVRAYMIRFKKLSVFLTGAALLLLLYQVTQSQSPILHLITGIMIFMVATNYFRIWIILKEVSEKIANSWKEWQWGPIRIINHGFYVGFGVFFCVFLAGWLAGSIYIWPILVSALIVIVFAALWAQFIEGSEKLKRPFGYYGGLVGTLLASLAVWLMGSDVWLVLGALTVGVPWGQAFGRLRCLINGCCHGRPTDKPWIGIKYFHHRSRVCGISNLKGEALHPTPLYSILWLFFLGFILLALWRHRFSYSFIFGIYLILAGIGRFVEEAYRGEVQTLIWKGLRLYQWTAIASVIVGFVMSSIPVEVITTHVEVGWQLLLASTIGGVFTFLAMGVDFPNSNARFSRLV